MYKISKIFELNEEITSYKYPIIKIVGSVAVYLVLLNRNKIFPVSGRYANIIFTLLALLITIVAIFCVYISVAEMMDLHDRRIDSKRKVSEISTKEYLISDIVEWVRKNDILEIEIKTVQGIIKVGCTSDCKLSNGKFFDKMYFVDNVEYGTIEVFKEKIFTYSDGEKIKVISIDGIAV